MDVNIFFLNKDLSESAYLLEFARKDGVSVLIGSD